MQSVMAVNQADVTRLSLEAADLQKAISASKAKQRQMEHEVRRKDQEFDKLQVHYLPIQISLTIQNSLPIQIILLISKLRCFHNVLFSHECLTFCQGICDYQVRLGGSLRLSTQRTFCNS